MCGFSHSYICVVFFFKQKTAYEMRISDWSSDVCSSDLFDVVVLFSGMPGAFFELGFDGGIDVDVIALGLAAHAPEAHAQPRQRLAQAVTFEPGDGSLGLDRRIDFLHGAPVVAVGLDRQSVGEGKRVAEREVSGGRGNLK